MIPVYINNYSPSCPAGSGQEVGGCLVNDFLCISGISLLFFRLGRDIIKK